MIIIIFFRFSLINRKQQNQYFFNHTDINTIIIILSVLSPKNEKENIYYAKISVDV